MKVDLKSNGKTKKRLKICPIEREDLKEEHLKCCAQNKTYWSLVYQVTMSPSFSQVNFLLT